MSSKKSLIFLGLMSAVMIAAIIAFNLWHDPLCYFRCDAVVTEKKSMNLYYETAQRILQYPDTELIVLGSSRGETLPLQWLTDKTGLKALNLSVGGAEIHTKSALLTLALQKLPLKKVIWISDYFEFMDETANDKIKFTPALRAHAIGLGAPDIFTVVKKFTTLIDHNTVQASFALLKKSRKHEPPNHGSNAGLDATKCLAERAASKLTEQALLKETGILYEGYAAKILKPVQNPQGYRLLSELVRSLAAKGIDLIVIIPPYHPAFTSRLAREQQEISGRHQSWRKNLTALSGEHITTLDFFDGIPGGDATPQYWNDGVHFSCRGAMAMLDGRL